MAKTLKMRLMTIVAALSLVSFGNVFSHNYFKETTKVAYADGVTFNEISDPSDFIADNIGECTFADAKQWVVDHWNDVEDIIRNDDRWVGVYFHVSGNLHWIRVTDSQTEDGKQAFIDSFDEDRTTSLSELQTLWDEDYFKYVYFCNPSSSGGGEPHTHDEKTFTAWESDSSLPDTSGSYYLTKNVVLDGTYYLNNLNLNLDLNGYCIVLGNGINISLSHTATLNLYDCNGSNSTWYITTNQYYDFESISDVYSESALEFTGGCITGCSKKTAIDADNSAFNMYGGTICCNSLAVLVNMGTFNMYGGKITYNGGSVGQYGAGVYATNNAVFNMLGGEISYNFARYAGSGVYLEYATFTMDNGIITHNGYSKGSLPSIEYARYGAGVTAFEHSTFTMNGGTISDNSCYWNGGGVYVTGTFIMNGGTISGNQAKRGGGVSIGSDNDSASTKNANCTIAGGSIINNIVEFDSIADQGKGGGISYETGTFTLSGGPVIKDNIVDNGDPNNIYINTFNDIKITLSGTLTNDTPYGITTASSYTNKNSFTDVNCDSYVDNFVSDNPNFKVEIKDDKSLYLEIGHIHSWKYQATGSQIEATCENADCPIKTGLILELQAPANLVYDGTAKEATFKEGYSAVAFPNPQIKYYQGANEVASCINAGSYTAKVTFGDATASIDFEITKATPTPTAVSDRNATYGQSLSEIDLPDGWAWNSPTDKVGNAGTRQHKATFTPEDSVNYKTVEQDVNVIVAKANPEYTIPTGLTALINKTLSTVTLPSGWSWDNPNENVGDVVGNKVFKGTFTPEDTDNYNIIEHVDITVLITEHQHNWSYAANGASITASCANPDCTVTEGLTLTLLAPTGDMHYDENAKVATIQAGYSLDAFPNPVIKYFKDNSEVNQCVNVGKYTAKVTFGNATASLEFEILATVISDSDSNVTIEIDDAVVPEDISIRVEVRADVKEKGIDADYQKIIDQIRDDEEIAKVYDVRLIRTVGGVDTEIQPSDIKPGLKIKVKMAIPEGIDIANSRILHIHSVDDMEFISDYKVEGDDLLFEIEKLSQFVFLTKVNAPAPEQGSSAGWVVPVVIIGSLLVLLAICFLLLFFVFAKYIIVKENDEDKVVKAIKLGKEEQDDKKFFKMMTFKLRRELKPEEEVFNNKQDAEEFLNNKKK